MSHGLIKRYQEQYQITARREIGVLQPEPLHIGWTNFVSQRSVRGIAVAPRTGYLWLATWGGVLSWNQREEFLYRRYSSEHGLAGNAVACICLDQTERPWVGHVEGGLSYYDGHRWQVYLHLQDEPIRVVCNAGETGAVWVAGESRLLKIRTPDQPPELVAENHDGVVRALALVADGQDVLVGNAWGLFRIRAGQEPAPVAQDKVRSCVALTLDGGGLVWLATPEEVFRLEGETAIGPFFPPHSDSVGRILALAAGRKRVWALTAKGLAHLDDDRWTLVPWQGEGQTPPSLRAIAAGADDAYLWVGTDNLLAWVRSSGAGESFWDLNVLPLHREDALNNLGRCVALLRGDDRVWVGTAGGLMVFGPGEAWTRISDVGDVRMLAAEDDLWLLTWPRGVRRLAGSGWPNLLECQPPGLATALAVCEDGSPAVFTGRGLWRLGDQPQALADSIQATVRCLTQTPGGRWWLGTTEGVYRLTAGAWELAGEQPGPGRAEVYALAVVGGTLWAATAVGLWARGANGWVLHSKELVRALAAASDLTTLWLARDDGVVRYDPVSGVSSEPYTPINSGLASRRVTALAERSSALWIVTQVGTSRATL